MPFDSLENHISDYAGSEHFMFLDPAVKEHAEGVLQAFFERLKGRGHADPESIKAKVVGEVLREDLPRLNLDVAVKRAIPDLLEGFFGYLEDTGRYPAAAAWKLCVEAEKARYRASLRDDGSVKGTTFKKKYTDVGRNDPCPCGSGKKFKKCCMPLIS